MITFVVRGWYGFPFHLLAADEAWPTPRGAQNLDRVSRRENRDEAGVPLDAVEVELRTARDRISLERWRREGWAVVETLRED